MQLISYRQNVFIKKKSYFSQKKKKKENIVLMGKLHEKSDPHSVFIKSYSWL